MDGQWGQYNLGIFYGLFLWTVTFHTHARESYRRDMPQMVRSGKNVADAAFVRDLTKRQRFHIWEELEGRPGISGSIASLTDKSFEIVKKIQGLYVKTG